MDAILQKVVFLNKKSGNFSFYSSFHLVISRRYEKSIFQVTAIFSSISGVFRRSDYCQYWRKIVKKVQYFQQFLTKMSKMCLLGFYSRVPFYTRGIGILPSTLHSGLGGVLKINPFSLCFGYFCIIWNVFRCIIIKLDDSDEFFIKISEFKVEWSK